jgi:deoxyribonuclease I
LKKNRLSIKNVDFKIVLFVVFVFLVSFFALPGFSAVTHHLTHEPPKNFTQAKKWAKQIYSDHRYTFYCGCQFDKHNKIDLGSCGYQIQTDSRRAKRIEWEHIVPISHLASHLPCWKNKLCCKSNGHCFKGRQCCRMIDPNFAKMEADLHNLVPEIGELNALRSNYRFGVLPFIQENQFGDCEFKIDPSTRRVEPAILTRGMIARAYLYMAEHYHWNLSSSQRQLFIAWNNQYPPVEWEIERNKRIEKIQGNLNPFISQYLEKKNKTEMKNNG